MQKMKPEQTKGIITIIIVLLLASALYNLYDPLFSQPPEETNLSEIAREYQAGTVKKIEIDKNEIIAELETGRRLKAFKEQDVSLVEYGIHPGEVEIEVKDPDKGTFWPTFLSVILPFLLLGGFIFFMLRQAQGANMRAMSFGKSSARLATLKTKTSFSDVAGLEEAKEELKEVVEFLRHPAKFKSLGAEIPKGVLLVGSPGTGKTLIARAVAGEAGVPFFSISASEFVEMFVGVGASVSSETPVLVKDEKGKAKLLPIGEFADSYFAGSAEGYRPVPGVATLGFEAKKTAFRSSGGEKKFFGGSAWQSIKGVYRHKVDHIYDIEYLGGKISATSDHSVFVREGNMVRSKRVSELKEGEALVNLPFKVRGAFVPGIGTTHSVRAHQFERLAKRYFEVWRDDEELLARHKYALSNASVLSRAEIAATVGVSETTVGNWQNSVHLPRGLSVEVFKSQKTMPQRVEITPELCRLFGYYLAEGRATKHFVEFTFGIKEKELHEDCARLIRDRFCLEPRIKNREEDSVTKITVSSVHLARSFKEEFGTGSREKRLPSFVWDLPREQFLALLEGWSKGDGYISKEGKLSVTSASKQLILEMNWLCAMHGIKAGVREIEQEAGRIIKAKPLPAGTYYILIIGSTTNPFRPSDSPEKQFKKPYIRKITKRKYSGFVYDLCGTKNEAFFGGEKPVLLHNSRVRDLFQKAKRNAPCVIFVDELDAIGRQRGAGLGGSHDEREQTLNQILVEMDGFDTDTKVIILAATNRPDVLDPALLRPGRFDRRVVLAVPDKKEREAILKIHTKNKPLEKSVDLGRVAGNTVGMSGADLRNVMNEAAIIAARKNQKTVTQDDLMMAVEKVTLGPERKSKVMSKKEKEAAAYHEAAHALVGKYLRGDEELQKISIVSRGMALGYTWSMPKEDKYMRSRDEFVAEIAQLLAGRAAEKMIFNQVTTGAANDLERASKIARNMVQVYGMSDVIGPVVIGERDELVFLGRELAEHKNYSEKIAAQVDSEVERIVLEGEKHAKQVLTKHKAKLKKLAELLLKKETIERSELNRLV